MSKFTPDSFLPSGAIEETSQSASRIKSTNSSSKGVDAAQYFPSPLPANSNISLKAYTIPPPSSRHKNGFDISSPSQTPISPPVSRSASTDDSSAELIEDWRKHTRNLREQHKKERAHLLADRDQVEELGTQERAMADKEIDLLKQRVADLDRENSEKTYRIVELEAQLLAIHNPHDSHHGSIDAATSPVNGQANQRPNTHTVNTATSVSGSIDGTSAKAIPQESGRNEDGSPFYAPAPRHPTRTFETSDADELRVDSMSTQRETPFRVTSRELTQSDFGLQSPPAEILSQDGSVAGESIDISLIEPELDGVPIKATALSLAFAEKVLSPNLSMSPSKLSPSIKSPPRPQDTSNGPETVSRKKSTLEVIAAPENRRLTMNAGHTPNHSVTAFNIGESGNATPTQIKHEETQEPNPTETILTRQFDGFDGVIDADPELKGPLGLTNNPLEDDPWLSVLDSKLEEVIKSRPTSPLDEYETSRDSLDAIEEFSLMGDLKEAQKLIGRSTSPIDEDEVDDSESQLQLRLKPSKNFGTSFGHL